MRIVFLGTDAFAVPSLEALAQAGHEVGLVVTQPDRPSGRGRASTPPPVKAAALGLGLPVAQPERVREAQIVERIQTLAPDAGVVVAYGQILPRTVFAAPRLGTVNVHASLLPRYRGAAPIQWAIASGEEETGVTTMMVEQGLDTGPTLLAARTTIGADETSADLWPRLADMGASLLIETLEGLERGTVSPIPQDEALATHAPIIRKEDGRIDWARPAPEISRRVRAFVPWPTAYTTFRGRQLRILSARDEVSDNAVETLGEPPPGTFVSVGRQGLVVACGEGTRLRLIQVQPESKRPMPAEAFTAGARPSLAERLG